MLDFKLVQGSQTNPEDCAEIYIIWKIVVVGRRARVLGQQAREATK